MSTKFTIFSPVSVDYADMAALHNRAMAPFLSLYTPEEHAAFGDDLFETAETIAELVQSRQVICAKENDVVTGYAAFRARNAQTVWISALYVDPAQQRKNIGARLLGAVENFSRANGQAILALETHARADWAIAFYLKNGFAIVNDRIGQPPHGYILDKPPVPGRPVLAKTIVG